jgi:hypothetical protein
MISFKDFLLETKTQAQIERLKITPEHINQALNDEAFKVRRAARFRLNKSNRNNDGI